MKSPVKCPNQAISGLQLCQTCFPPLRLTGKGVPGRTSYYWAPLYPVSDLAISDSHMAKSDLVPPPETCSQGDNPEIQLLLDTPYTLLRLSHFRG